MGAVSFRKKDFSSGGFALKGVYQVRAVSLVENNYGDPSKNPDLMLQFEVEGEDGAVRNAQWRVGPTVSKAGEIVYSTVNDGKSVDGPPPFADSEIALLMGSLEDKGFDMESLEDSATDEDGKPYFDLTKIAGNTFRFAEHVTPNTYKDKKTGEKITKDRTTSIVVEIVGSAKKVATKAAAKANGTAKASKAAPEPEADDLDTEVRRLICVVAAEYTKDGEKAPIPITQLGSKIASKVGPKAANRDQILAKVSDYDFIEDDKSGLWAVERGKVSLTKSGTALVEA